MLTRKIKWRGKTDDVGNNCWSMVFKVCNLDSKDTH